jgi:hypothetical protein
MFKTLLLGVEVFLNLDLGVLESSLSLLKTFLHALVDLVSISKHFVVELKLLLVQLVDCLHVFHAALQNLHLLLKQDLLLGLVVSIVSPDALEFLVVLLFLHGSLGHLFLLKILLLLKQSINFFFVAFLYLFTLKVKLSLNVVKLSRVIFSHLKELLPHVVNQLINVIILFLKSLNVCLLLNIKLLHELFDQLILLSDDLPACIFLDFYVFSQLLTVFLLL